MLKPLEGEWHDGDENLVRGLLDRWQKPGQHDPADTAHRLLAAAAELDRIQARPQTWWFFLWQLESVLAGLVAELGRC